MQDSTRHSVRPPAVDQQQIPRNRGVRDRYEVALDAALEILEIVDTRSKSNMPVRLAKVIGTVLDAIYESEKPREGDKK